ncbi:MAG: Gluconolactonase [Novosphingobium sp.]|nr:Gluconolactonase [Novosphingobium sp.]
MSNQPVLVWPVGALLGEGPVWCADEAALRFVDIKGGRLHRFDPATGAANTHEIGGQPSFIVPVADGGFLVGSGHDLRRFDGHSLGDAIAAIEMPHHNRTNDATVDAAGRLWFGTMDDNEQMATGALHCFDRGVIRTTTWTACITNGPAISRDGQALYHVDSAARTIWRIPLDGGSLAAAGEIFIRIAEADGHPDGVVVDSEDCLWVALWDGWGVRRYSPDGTLLFQVGLPCARVTKLAFGGPDLKTAFVTTARTGLDAAALAAQPLAGGLFAFAAPAAGRLQPAVELT